MNLVIKLSFNIRHILYGCVVAKAFRICYNIWFKKGFDSNLKITIKQVIGWK